MFSSEGNLIRSRCPLPNGRDRILLSVAQLAAVQEIEYAYRALTDWNLYWPSTRFPLQPAAKPIHGFGIAGRGIEYFRCRGRRRGQNFTSAYGPFYSRLGSNAFESVRRVHND